MLDFNFWDFNKTNRNQNTHTQSRAQHSGVIPQKICQSKAEGADVTRLNIHTGDFFRTYCEI